MVTVPHIRIKGSPAAVEQLFENEKAMELLMLRSLFDRNEPTDQNHHEQEPALAEFL